MIETLLGLDIGTTSTKAVLFDLAGKELAREISAPYRNHTPNPGWVEQNPEELWQVVLNVIRNVLGKTTVPAQAGINVLALCMAAQSGSLLPVDAQGDPVYPLITWMDGRTVELVRQWQEEGLEPQVKAISGWSLYPGLCLPTIAWLKQHNPLVFSNAKRYFSVNDFIAYRLTGQKFSNLSNGGGMQLVDIHDGQWSGALCALAGITRDQLSPIMPAGSTIGKILPDLCRFTGLSSETILVNGGHDQGCTALGLGITTQGKYLLACGTAWVITGVTTSPDLGHIPAVMDLNFHPAPARWTISQSLGGLGASLEWWANQFLQNRNGQQSRDEIYGALNKELSETTPGSNGLYFLPLTGGHSGPATNQRGAFLGLQMSHTRAHMARAVLESAAFELRWVLEKITAAGLPVDKLWMVGGAVNSPFWPMILTNVTRTPISIPQYDNWPALGAAILAGIGAGVFNTIEQGLVRFQKPVRDIAVDEAESLIYDKCFITYQEYAPIIYSKFA
jgi:xylulokinase